MSMIQDMGVNKYEKKKKGKKREKKGKSFFKIVAGVYR